MKISASLNIIIILFIALLLAGCGGGSEEPSNNNQTPTNQAPIVNAGTDQTVGENSQVLLNGSATDDEQIVSYNWRQVSGIAITLSDAGSANAAFTAPEVTANETLVFELVATDNLGATNSSTVSVIIQNINKLPLVDAGADQTISELEEVQLSASASDADGTIDSIKWTQTAGMSVTIVNEDTLQASFTAPEVNEDSAIEFEVTVTDNEDAVTRDTLTINIQDIRTSPTVNINSLPEFLLEGQQYELNVQVNDFDRPIESYKWESLNNNVDIVFDQTDAANVKITVPPVTLISGLSIQVTVTDIDGKSVSDQISSTLVPVASDTTRPNATDVVSTTVLGNRSFSIDWLAAQDDLTPSSLLQYEIHVDQNPRFTPTPSTLLQTIINDNTAIIDGLNPSTIYHAKIVAYDLNRNFSWSLEQTISLPLNPPTMIVSPVDLGNTSNLSIDSANNTLEFSVENAPTIDVNDILVSQENEGFLVRVLSVVETNNMLVVKYENTSLGEVFENFNLNFSLNLSDALEAQNSGNAALVSSNLNTGKDINKLQWQKSSLTIQNNLDSRSRQGLRGQTNTSSSKATSNVVSTAEKADTVSGAATIRNIQFEVAAPNDLISIDIESFVTQAFSDYQLLSLSFKGLKHKNLHPFESDFGASFTQTATDENAVSGQFLWQTNSLHIDHEDAEPFIAVFEALASRCSVNWFNASWCSDKVEVEIPIYVGYFDNPIDKPLRDTIVSADNALLQASAEVSVDFNSNITAYVETRNKLLENAEFLLGGSLTFNANAILTASAQDSTSASLKLIDQSFRKIVFLGQVPVVITGDYAVTVIIDASVEGEVNLTNELEVTLDVGAGIKYERSGDGWTPIQMAEPSFTYTIKGEAEAEAEVTVRLVPELTMKIYSFAAATIVLEPYLYAEAALEGRFDYLQYLSPNRDINDADSQYRFTTLEAGIGVNAKLRAGLEAFSEGIIGYPSADLDELKEIVLREKTPTFGLPTIDLEELQFALPYSDSTSLVLSAQTNDLPNPFTSDGSSLNPFVTDSGFWQVFPETGDFSIQQIQQDNRDLAAFSYSFPTMYTLRYVGHSKIGGFVRQYEEFQFDANDYDNDGMPDIWESKWGVSNPDADEDFDGLSNLEEFTNKTSPKNPDSDNDGTSDTEEIANGSNPIDQTGPLLLPDADFNTPPIQPVLVIEGAISSFGEIDEYEFELLAGESVHFRIADMSGPIEPEVWLYNPDGTLHQRYSSSDVVVINCVAGDDGNCQLTQSGPYKLVIADVRSNEVGDYQIQYTRVIETNENGALSNDNAVSGDLSLGDLDSFVFNASANEALHIRVADMSGPIEPEVWLYNPDGTLHQRYSSSGVVVINCVAGDDGNCQLTQSGPYKLVIADVSSNEVGDYQIEFSGSPQAIVAGSSFDWPLNIDGGLPILTQDHSDLGQVVENKFHAGVDLLNMGPDNTIYAANVGIVHSTVTGCENNVDACGNRFGNYVIIRHDGQFYEGKVIYSLYAHLAPNSITVSKDQVVTKGMPIGILGATGKVSGPHLHFETSVNSGLGVFAYTNSHPIGDDYLDPWAYLNATKIPPTVIQINEGPNLNIRNKPGVDLSLVVAAAERNQMFVSFASIRKGNGDIWHRIHLPCGQKRSNCAGWLATKFEGESNVSVQGANLIAVAIDAGINGSDIYTVPNTSASVIDTMFDTQSFAVREIAEPGSGCDSSWYKIDLPNTFGMLEGWVCGDDVQLF